MPAGSNAEVSAPPIADFKCLFYTESEESTKSTPKKRKPTSGGEPSPPQHGAEPTVLASSCASLIGDDLASVCGNVYSQNGSYKSKWIHKPYPDLALEKGNLGVWRFHAKEALPKIGPNSEEGLALSEHFVVYDAYHELREKNIFKLSTRICVTGLLRCSRTALVEPSPTISRSTFTSVASGPGVFQ